MNASAAQLAKGAASGLAPGVEGAAANAVRAAGQGTSSIARAAETGYGGLGSARSATQVMPEIATGTPVQPSIYKSLESTTAKLGQGIKNTVANTRQGLSEAGQGLQKVTSLSPEGTAARSQFWDTSKYPIMAAGASSMLAPSSTASGRAPIDPNAPTAKFDPNYQAYRTYDPSARAPDSSSERMYYAKDGGLMSLAVGGPANGPVQQMSNQNAIGANTGYPMAADSTPSYSVASANPISENMIRPQGESNVDPYTGAERFDNGGMVSTLRGLLGNAMPQAY